MTVLHRTILWLRRRPLVPKHCYNLKASYAHTATVNKYHSADDIWLRGEAHVTDAQKLTSAKLLGSSWVQSVRCPPPPLLPPTTTNSFPPNQC